MLKKFLLGLNSFIQKNYLLKNNLRKLLPTVIKNKLKSILQNRSSNDQSATDYLLGLALRAQNDLNRECLENLELSNLADNIFSVESKKRKIAALSILPPMQSGIALYDLKLFSVDQESWDIYSPIDKVEIYGELYKKSKNIYPLFKTENFFNKRDYAGYLYVLGNSFHHKEILLHAINSKGLANRALYLHEAFLYDLFKSFFNYGGEKFLIEWYPHLGNLLSSGENIYSVLTRNEVYCITPLLELTGIKKVFVNNDRCSELISRELVVTKRKGIDIKCVFHPIDKITDIKKIRLRDYEDEYVIGSFGIASELKYSDILLEAVGLLLIKGVRIRLIYAGYYLKGSLVDKGLSYVSIVDSPSDEYLLEIMNSVDLAIQLRKQPHGESSGCIAQLLGMGQRILVTDNIVDKNVAPYCNVCTSEFASDPVCLAGLIENILLSRYNRHAYDFIYENYSFANLSKILCSSMHN